MEQLKTTAELLSYLGSLDIKLWVEGDRLKFDAPFGALTPELRTQIKEQKTEIIAFLQKEQEWGTLNQNYQTIERINRDEEQLGTPPPLATLFSEPTIEGQASLLNAAPNTQFFSPLVPIRPKGSLPPFFCIHPMGGNVFCYADLVRQLDVEQPFYSLQSVGFNGQQEPLTRIEDMATTYIQAIQTVQPQGPYRLGGWSFGGIVAFEMAQQLEAVGDKVEMLALIDSSNPTALNNTQEDEAMLVASFAKAIGLAFDKELSVSVDELRQLELNEKLNYVLKKIHLLLPLEIKLEQMCPMFAVFQTNTQAKNSYVISPYSGQITLFYADGKSEELTQQQIQGWSSLAAGGINIHKIPGDHYSIISSEPLAKELSSYLGC